MNFLTLRFIRAIFIFSVKLHRKTAEKRHSATAAGFCRISDQKLSVYSNIKKFVMTAIYQPTKARVIRGRMRLKPMINKQSKASAARLEQVSSGSQTVICASARFVRQPPDIRKPAR